MFTPLAQSLADHAGLHLTTVLMLQVFAYATPLLPYQAAPLVVAAAFARTPMRATIASCLLIAFLSFVLLAPLYYLWFRLLGWIG